MAARAVEHTHSVTGFWHPLMKIPQKNNPLTQPKQAEGMMCCSFNYLA